MDEPNTEARAPESEASPTADSSSDPEQTDEAVKADTPGADEEVVSTTAASSTDILPEKRWRGRRVLTIVAASLFLLVLLAAAGVAYATYDFKNEYEGKLLPGAVVAGVDVGGMTKQDAVKAVKKAIGPKLKKEVTVSFGKEEWTVTPKELGARNNARGAVKAALAASEEASFRDLAEMRFFDEELDISEDVSIRQSKKGAEAFVAGLEKEVNAAPVDAAIDYSSGWVEISEERVGHELSLEKSADNLMAALKKGDPTAQLEVNEIKPAVTDDDFDQVILVRQSDFRVYLYDDGKITHDWPIAIGTSEYPTPTGVYSVELKRYMPTWINPAPDGWGADMPAEIPPGPDNPLGLRAINWTAPAIRFHGTSATSSIGTAASHGCVRMLNDDVIEMYDLVEEGSPIVSIWG
jgi:lipoprotein-anchoring transpeptidase ErfK/SrfK